MHEAVEKAEAVGIHTRNREGVAEQTAALPTRTPTIPLTLRETYERYKAGKGIGRQDLFGKMVDEIEALQKRIGSVDEAAVSALDKRLSSLETVIGNALRSRATTSDSGQVPIQGWEPASEGPAATPEEWREPRYEKRKPGRPSNAEIAAREANNG